MNIVLKKSRKATYNYTNRSNIRQKDCHVTIIEHTPEQMHIKLSLDLEKIDLRAEQALVLEALYKGIYFRKKLINPKQDNDIYIDGFPENSNPSFRVKLLPQINGGNGQILSASKFFKATKSEEDKEIQQNFLSFTYSDSIGDQIWKIEWEDPENPLIYVNKKFAEQYEIKTDARVHAFMLPALLREILNGIFLRFNSIENIDERSQAYRWLKFCDRKLTTWSMPDEEEWNDKLKLSELAEQAVYLFSEKKWDGKRTLLEKFLDKIWGT
jgi:hypothetical protein